MSREKKETFFDNLSDDNLKVLASFLSLKAFKRLQTTSIKAKKRLGPIAERRAKSSIQRDFPHIFIAIEAMAPSLKLPYATIHRNLIICEKMRKSTDIAFGLSRETHPYSYLAFGYRIPNDASILPALCQKELSGNFSDSELKNYLNAAIAIGNFPLVKWLIENEWAENKTYVIEDIAWYLAARSGNLTLFQYLLSTKNNITPEEILYILHGAIESGDPTLVKCFISIKTIEGVSIFEMWNNNPLMQHAVNLANFYANPNPALNLALVEQLLATGISPQEQLLSSETSLSKNDRFKFEEAVQNIIVHATIKSGDLSLVKELLSKNLLLPSLFQKIFFMAMCFGKLELAQQLTSFKGEKIDFFAGLKKALTFGNLASAQWLIEEMFSSNIEIPDPLPLLKAGAESKNIVLMKWLIQRILIFTDRGHKRHHLIMRMAFRNAAETGDLIMAEALILMDEEMASMKGIPQSLNPIEQNTLHSVLILKGGSKLAEWLLSRSEGNQLRLTEKMLDDAISTRQLSIIEWLTSKDKGEQRLHLSREMLERASQSSDYRLANWARQELVKRDEPQNSAAYTLGPGSGAMFIPPSPDEKNADAASENHVPPAPIIGSIEHNLKIANN